MASSQQIEGELKTIFDQMNPLLEGMPGANGYFKQGLSKAYNDNLPLLKEAAGLEAGAYTLPGQLLGQYDKEYGNTFNGPSGLARINSILGRVGNQFAMSDVAGNLAKQKSARIEDMAKSLTDQYGLMLQGMQQKYNMKMPLYQSALQKEQEDRARAEAAAARSAANSPLNFNRLQMNQRPATPQFGLEAQAGGPSYPTSPATQQYLTDQYKTGGMRGLVSSAAQQSLFR